MTTDFSQLTDGEIVDFVVQNSALFADDIDDSFRRDALLSLGAGATVIVRRPEGFAIVEKGRPHEETWGSKPADLMFIHVADEHAGKGIGGELIDEVKRLVSPELPITLICEGAKRMRFFQKHGFEVRKEWAEAETYRMQFR